MVQQAEEPNDVLADQGRPLPDRPTRRPARIAAMVAYAVLLLVWIEFLGIPNDTLQVFLWLWLGTIAWNIEAQPRYHLNFLRDWWLPVAGLAIYFYSRGLTDELGLPELDDFADIMRLSGEEGASVYANLRARSAAMRTAMLNDELAQANAVGERMTIPGSLLGVIFMALLVAPSLLRMFSNT